MSRDAWIYLKDALYDLVYFVKTDEDAEIINKEVKRILQELQDLEGV